MTNQTNSIQTKNSFFFSHDSNARNDEKIVELRMEHGAEGYGVYFMLIEMLMETSDYMLTTQYKALAFGMQLNKEVVRSVVEDFDLFDFSDDMEYFFSPSLLKRIAPLEQLREKRRQAGLLGLEAKRKKRIESEEEQKKTASQIPADHLLSKPLALAAKNLAEESREEKSRVEESREEESREEEMEVAKAPSEAKADRFVPPTPQALESYCIDNKYDIDTNAFLDFYQSKGWMVGKNKMKDWQAAVRNWVRKDQEDARKRRHGLPMIRQPNIANHKNNKAYEQF